MHLKTKSGYVPLHGCRSAKNAKLCKHLFPREQLEQRRVKKHVICKGNAKRFKMKLSGRRNALGMILGRRHSAWQSGCPKSFGVFFRCNTNTLPNYRVPPNTETHDDEHCQGCTNVSEEEALKLSKVTSANTYLTNSRGVGGVSADAARNLLNCMALNCLALWMGRPRVTIPVPRSSRNYATT